jgi:hypothetical protein
MLGFESLLVAGTEQAGRHRDYVHGGGLHFFLRMYAMKKLLLLIALLAAFGCRKELPPADPEQQKAEVPPTKPATPPPLSPLEKAVVDAEASLLLLQGEGDAEMRKLKLLPDAERAKIEFMVDRAKANAVDVVGHDHDYMREHGLEKWSIAFAMGKAKRSADFAKVLKAVWDRMPIEQKKSATVAQLMFRWGRVSTEVQQELLQFFSNERRPKLETLTQEHKKRLVSFAGAEAVANE